jgi:hypothetical protein
MTPLFRIESELFPPPTSETPCQNLIEQFKELRTAWKNVARQIAKVITSPTSLRRNAQERAPFGISQRPRRPLILRRAEDRAVIVSRNRNGFVAIGSPWGVMMILRGRAYF